MGINRNTADITRNAVAKSGDTMTGAIQMPDGSAGAPSITFSGDTNTGIYRSGIDTLNFATGGTSHWKY